MTPSPALRVGRTANGYCLRVEGRATQREHPALFELFVVQVLDHTPCLLVVDLTTCKHVDDRFLDTLLDLGLHYGCGGSARFAIAVGPETGLVAWNPLASPLAVLPEAPKVLGDEFELPPLAPGTVDLEDHLADWHGRLARLGGPYVTRFKRRPEPLLTGLACH